jgi:hypothetical protein
VTYAHALAQRRSIVPVRSALGHPQEALVIQEEAVRKRKEPRAEAAYQVPIKVEFHYRIQVGAGALVPPTAVQDPQVLSIWIRKDSAHRSQLSPFGEVLPAEAGAIWVGGGGLGVQPFTQHYGQHGKSECERRANSMGTRHMDLLRKLFPHSSTTTRGGTGRLSLYLGGIPVVYPHFDIRLAA